MSLGQYYKYNGTALNNIFSSNSSDISCNNYISSYKYNGSQIGPFNTGNGEWGQQTTIPIKVNLTSISAGVVAYYEEFTTAQDHQVQDLSGCTYLKFVLIGAGGSGGAGGGDVPGKNGANGGGGGGGGIWLGTLQYDSTKSYKVNVGSGGSSVSGSAGNNIGNSGYDGGNTTIYINNSASSYYANGGERGLGGGPSTTGRSGSGGANNSFGAVYSNSGLASIGMTKGGSGYNSTYLGFTQYPVLYGNNTYLYGYGGNGTPGKGDPNQDPTGAGNNGYARVYYIF